MLDFVWNLASFIIALGILVAVHEFGHFWVARRCGVKVHKFSIGFGYDLWKRTDKSGTEYSISLIPLGGYVKMLDGRTDEIKEEDKSQAFDHKPLWQRCSIVAAGPVFNFLFAIFACWLMFVIGVSSVKPIISQVLPNSVVEQAGVQPGMELIAVNGVQTPDWQAANMQLASYIGEKQIQLTLKPEGHIDSNVQVLLDTRQWEVDLEKELPLTTLGIVPFVPQATTQLSRVAEGGAAAVAGLQSGDTITEVAGDKVTQWSQIVEKIQKNALQPLVLTVNRKQETLTLTLVPEQKERNGQLIGMAGISPVVEEWPAEYLFEQRFNPIEAVGKATGKTYQLIELTFRMLKKLFVGDVGIENLSGPISIAKGAGATANYGLVHFLSFLALISVNLGIINLMPLPILDGGHLLFYAIEAIIRKPVPEKVQEMGFRIGGALIFALMAVAIFNDFMRL